MDRYQEIRLAVIRVRHSVRARADSRNIEADGGPGSGNWGHRGRIGKVGGSEKGGGGHNRQKEENGPYTSFSKQRREASKIHAATEKDIGLLSKVPTNDHGESHDIRVVDEKGRHYKKVPYSNSYQCVETGESRVFKEGDKIKIAIPRSMDPNYTYTEADQKAVELNRERFKKAFRAETGHDVSRKLEGTTKKVWEGCSQEAKDALEGYTDDEYESINDALRYGVTSNGEYNRKIEHITGAIENSVLDTDMILHRGIGKASAEKMFGLPPGYMDSPGRLSLNGRVGTDDAFMSTGGAEGTGFSYKDVKLEIMAPKGTKGLYCEPFSAHANSSECEVLLQRGTSLQIIGYRVEETDIGRQYVINAVVTGQDTGRSEYSRSLGTAK